MVGIGGASTAGLAVDLLADDVGVAGVTGGASFFRTPARSPSSVARSCFSSGVMAETVTAASGCLGLCELPANHRGL